MISQEKIEYYESIMSQDEKERFIELDEKNKKLFGILEDKEISEYIDLRRKRIKFLNTLKKDRFIV